MWWNRKSGWNNALYFYFYFTISYLLSLYWHNTILFWCFTMIYLGHLYAIDSISLLPDIETHRNQRESRTTNAALLSGLWVKMKIAKGSPYTKRSRRKILYFFTLHQFFRSCFIFFATKNRRNDEWWWTFWLVVESARCCF